MSWGEALRLTRVLCADPSSSLAASLNGWEYPFSRTDMALAHLYDLHHQIAWAQGGKKGGRPKPYPRPWAGGKTRKRAKPDQSLSQDEIIAALRFAGHTAPIPTRSAEVTSDD